MKDEILEFDKLKSALLQINGSLLRLGVDREDMYVVLPSHDWAHFNIVLKTKQSGLHKFYKEVDDFSFMLAGLKVVSSTKERVVK